MIRSTSQAGPAPEQAAHQSQRSQYPRFLLMIVVSSVVMYVFMYFNTDELDHVSFSWTRLYMTMLMASAMSVIMLSFMRNMYRNRAANWGIYLGSAVLFAAGLWLVRSQALVGDVAYMRAMIPHYSIAILTSTRARIKDPRVRRLADGIIATQVREIGEMKGLIQDLQK